MMMPQASRGMKGRRITRQAVTSRIVRPMWMDGSSARFTWVLSYSGLRNITVESSCLLKLTLGACAFEDAATSNKICRYECLVSWFPYTLYYLSFFGVETNPPELHSRHSKHSQITSESRMLLTASGRS